MKRLMAIVLETAGATRGILVLRNERGEWRVQLGASVEESLTPPPPVGTLLGEEGTVSPADAAAAPVATAAAIGLTSPSDITTVVDKGSVSAVAPADTASAVSPVASSEQSSVELLSTITSSTDNVSSRDEAQRKLETALPQSVFRYVVSSRETVLLSDPAVPSHLSAFSGDTYFTASPTRAASPPHALLCMPVLQAGLVYGVLYVENDFSADAFTSSHIQLLQLLCGQAALSLDNARLYTQLSQHNAQLEETVKQRTQELETAMRQA